MIDNRIGYIICETATTEDSESKIINDINDRLIIEMRLQDMNLKNRNGRFYSDRELKPQLESGRIKELLEKNSLYGENGHPMIKDISRQQVIDPNNRAMQILKIWTEGNDIMAHVRGARGEIGKTFDEDIRYGGEKPAASLRALGTVANTPRGAEVKNITIITWDRVIFPSHKSAYMTKIVNVNESSNIGSDYGNKLVLDKNDAGLLIPINNSQVIDYIKDKSTNIHTIKESFDLLYDDITILENKRQVQLCDKSGNTFIINLENHLQNLITDYCDKNYFR